MPSIARPYRPDVGPLIDVCVADAGTLFWSDEAQLDDSVWKCRRLLIDTGSSATCLSRRVAESLNLQPQSQVEVETPGGKARANPCIVNLAIVFDDVRHHIHGHSVLEYNGSNARYEGLLGRDIPCKGIFSMSKDERYTFSI